MPGYFCRFLLWALSDNALILTIAPVAPCPRGSRARRQTTGAPAMKTLLLIGMGPGHPEQITVQAINALNRASVLFLLDKGETKDDLLNLRKDICERYIQQPGCRQVQVSDPVREDSAASYEAGVEHWHRQRAALFARLIDEELGEDESGAFRSDRCRSATRYARTRRRPTRRVSSIGTGNGPRCSRG